MENIWTEEFPVRTWDVDRTGRLHAAAAFNYFQEIAGNHAEALGVGKAPLAATGHAWILSRMTAVILRRSGWGETLNARTWPRGTDRLFAVRDYELLDSDSEIVGRGRSGWIVLDTQKMRPVRPGFLTDSIPLNEGRDAVTDGIGSLESFPDLEPVGSRDSAYSDIDYNGHVNNARYVQWIQDALPREALENSAGYRIDVNYLSEVKPGASVDFFCGQRKRTGNDGAEYSFYAFEGRHRDGGQPSFRAEIRLF